MQLPNKVRPATSTEKGVGMAESGFAIQMYGVPGARTSTWPSASRLSDSSTEA